MYFVFISLNEKKLLYLLVLQIVVFNAFALDERALKLAIAFSVASLIFVFFFNISYLSLLSITLTIYLLSWDYSHTTKSGISWRWLRFISKKKKQVNTSDTKKGSGFLTEKECSYTGLNFCKKQRSQMNIKLTGVSIRGGGVLTIFSARSSMTSGMRIGSLYLVWRIEIKSSRSLRLLVQELRQRV